MLMRLADLSGKHNEAGVELFMLEQKKKIKNNMIEKRKKYIK